MNFDRRFWPMAWLAISLLAGGCTPPQRADLAIVNVTVVDVNDGSLRVNQTVLVEGNRITRLAPTERTRVSDTAETVEATGMYLIPGLWDMHTHSISKMSVDRTDSSIPAQDWHFPLLLAHGVTGMRNMNDGATDVTLELSNSIRRRLAEGDLIGPPRFFTAGPSIDGDPPLASNPVVVRTAEEARAAVKQLAANGADLVKPYENLSREAYFAMVDEASQRGIPVHGHVPFRLTPEEVAQAGQRTVEHPEALAAGCATGVGAERERFDRLLAAFDRLREDEQFLAIFRHMRALYDTRDEATCASALEAYREHAVAVAVDLIAYHHVVHAEEILADPEHMRFVPEATRRNWEDWLTSDAAREFQEVLQPIPALELDNVRIANEAGVTLLAATDVGVPFQVPGLGMHEELARLVEAGLTPLAALQAATLNPARVLDLADSLGTVEAGKLADLILLDANPLDDITNTRKIRAVVADGRLYRRADLDGLMAGVQVRD